MSTFQPIETARPRSGRVLAVVAFVLVALLVAGVLAWRGFTRSPAHAVGRAAKAAQAKDWEAFGRYVDVDAVLDSAYDDIAGEALPDEDSVFGGIAAGLTVTVKPAVIAQARAALRTAIESGMATTRGGNSPLYPLIVAGTVTTVTRTPEEAFVVVDLPVGNERTLTLGLRMVPAEGSWRVIRLENVTELALDQAE